MKRIALLVAIATTLSAPAAAHIMLQQREAEAGRSYRAVLTVPHGCRGQPTTGITVSIPEGVFAVKPQPKPGWQLVTRSQPYQRAYTNHGREVREGVVEISWSGGSLDNAHYDEFVFVGQVDASLADKGTVHFPVVQTCASGEHRWVDLPKPGETAQLDQPAPALRIVQAQAGGGHGAAAPAAVFEKAGIRIEQPWTRATPGGARVGGGYLRITNTGQAADRLVAGQVTFAERVEIHEMAVAGGVMTMRNLPDGLEIPAGQTVELKPGGYHVMFMGLRQPLTEGQVVKATLTFARAGTIEIDFRVGSVGGRNAPGGGHHHHH
ncbi:DUF1775 domain-containing protein [Phreatobacter sp.]|uniref:DUF1775 domain-containing protein n=1 Tax=Phreatobacter sp. TaxID=1966341 RepID=UPI003F72D3F0